MSRKAIRVQVELDIHAVTCPGVWLCPNGKVSLQLFMLDSCIQTTGLQPVFPLLYHEQFIFYKTFYSAHSLNEIQNYIDEDFLYAELVQWQKCDEGNVIATFQSSLNEVLYPSSYEGAVTGVDVDLLMEPSKNFPGIIAPKIEVSTRTTIEEVLCSNDDKKCNTAVINPKTIPSDYCPCDLKRNQTRQQKVCHSVNYHRSKKCSRQKKTIKTKEKPPFAYKKAEEELIARKPQGLEGEPLNSCKCCISNRSMSMLLDTKKVNLSPRTGENYLKADDLPMQCPKLIKVKPKHEGHGKFKKYLLFLGHSCTCGSDHTATDCPVCSKYDSYFDQATYTKRTVPTCDCSRSSCVQRITAPDSSSDYNKKSCCSPARNSKQPCQCSQAKLRNCQCSASKTSEEESNECKPCGCHSHKTHNCNRLCVCSQSKKTSLAKKIHQRLMQTLDCAMPGGYVDDHCILHNTSGSTPVCSCPKFRNCQQGFYKDLGRFYKDLYRC